MGEFAGKAEKGHEILDVWKLMARNMINRAKASILIFGRKGIELPEDCKGILEVPKLSVHDVLSEMRSLREETKAFFLTTIKPLRTDEYMNWMYDAVDAELEKMLGQ